MDGRRNEYELTAEDSATIEAEAAKSVKPAKTPRRPRGPRFVQVTAAQVDRLEHVTDATTIKVFLRLLFLSFKVRGRPFVLPSAPDAGHRKRRHRALLNLERRGLISVQRNRGKPTSVTIATVPPDGTPGVPPGGTLCPTGRDGNKISKSKLA